MTTQARITERFAGSLGWHGKEYVVWDCDLDGFGVRVWGPGSRKGYVVQAKRDGRSFRKALGKVGQISQEKARLAATAFRGVVKDGRNPHAEDKAARDVWTLDDAMDHFRGDYAAARNLSEGHKTNFATAYKHHTPFRWKTMRLADISQAMIAARHKEITGGVRYTDNKARGGSRRANEWLALMSRLFTLGAQHGCPVNPATGIKKNAETERDRYLSPSEIKTLWMYLDTHTNVEAAVCVQFILLTGCRPGEAYTMRWTDLDKNTGTWRKPAPKTKQRKAHTVRLSDRARAVVERLETWKRSPYLFPSPEDASQPRSDKLKAFWHHVRKNCALADVRLYDCRHSFASWLAMDGRTELELAAQLGHRNTQTTKRYVHIAQEHLKRNADIMGAVIDKALADHSHDQLALVAEKKGNAVTLDLGSAVLEDVIGGKVN